MRGTWPLLLLLGLGCTADEPPVGTDSAATGDQDPAVSVRVIRTDKDLTRTEVGESVARSRLAGQYAVGALGAFEDLELQADGSFVLTEGGCMGVYGTAAGLWHLDTDGVALVTSRADGTLADRPPDRRLGVGVMAGRYVLFDESDRGRFRREGARGVIVLDPLAARWMRRTAETQRAPDRGGQWSRDSTSPRRGR